MTERGDRRTLAALLLGLCALSAAALEVPYLAGRVNDLAGMVDADTRTRLEARLAALEEATGAQVVVLTVPGLEGENLEDFSLRVAETWRLGRGEVDDGVLFLVARDDRKMRLEVGYGLEGRLTDALAGRILDGAVRPRFRDGDFAGGVEAGVEAVAGLLEGDPDALPPERLESEGGENRAVGAGVLAFFLVVILPFVASALFTKGFGGWFLYLFLMPFWGIFPFAILGAPWGLVPLAAWVVVGGVARLLFAGARGDALRKRHPWLVGTGRGGGGWSSRGGGGGFSGGGFSGGGGSFGGGGASSSW